MSRDCCVALPHDTTGLLQFVTVVFPDHTHLLFFMLHIILLRAHFSQNVKYWYEIHDVLVPIFHAL